MKNIKGKGKIVVSKKEVEKLEKTYPAVKGVIEQEINTFCKYYEKKPFNEREKLVFLKSIKDWVKLINENIPEDTELSSKESLLEIYINIKKILMKYCDLKERYYPIITLWIMGTYFHHQFETYPYLFLNAMKGSGKTRLLKLIAFLSKDGEVLASLSEAVLFRTRGTLCIDEFEGITRKGNDNLRELLNTAYKKGTTVKRMKKKHTMEGEEQVVEEFRTFRPIALANIWGMESVLGDRCISVVLEKSSDKKRTMLLEIFDKDELTTQTKKLFQRKSVVLCSVVTSGKVYVDWNDYITNNYITTQSNNYTKLHTLFDKLIEAKIDGRNLELCMPLLIIAQEINDEIFEEVLGIMKEITEERRNEEFIENKDVSLIDFVSQELDTGNYISVKKTAQKFKEFLQSDDDWINSKWIGRALVRLGLVKKKKRSNFGVEVVLDIEKAKEKMKMFR